MTLGRETLTRLIKDRELGLTPFDDDKLEGSSYTFTLAETLRLPARSKLARVLDLRQEQPEFTSYTMHGRGYELLPGNFVLGETRERLTLNGRFRCALSTGAQLAEAGLDVLPSGRLTDTDTDQPQVVKIRNHGGVVVLLYPGMPCVTGVFSRVE